jgi:hypothetical protein
MISGHGWKQEVTYPMKWRSGEKWVVAMGQMQYVTMASIDGHAVVEYIEDKKRSSEGVPIAGKIETAPGYKIIATHARQRAHATQREH